MGISDEIEDTTIATDETTISQIKATIYKVNLKKLPYHTTTRIISGTYQDTFSKKTSKPFLYYESRLLQGVYYSYIACAVQSVPPR